MEVLLKIGKRWSKVAKSLGRRTEHMVKNRYKTVIGRQKRLHPGINDEDSLFRLFLQEAGSNYETLRVEEKTREELLDKKER